MSDRTDLSGETPDPFVVRLAELPVSRTVELDPVFVSESVSTLAMRQALESDAPDAGEASATIELYQSASCVFARGQLKGWIEVACSRCIEPVRLQLDEVIAVSYLPASEVPEDDPEAEAEVTEDDEDLFPYEGEAINLTDLFRERLILAVPFAPLCKESCKGLCAVCGNNLNQSECGCDRTPVDPRLAPLRDIKLPT